MSQDGMRCYIKPGWYCAGRGGKVLGPNVYSQQDWTPVLWDDDPDPTFHKTAGLYFAPEGIHP